MSSAFRFYVPFDAADRSPRVVPRTLDERFNDPISDWGGEGGLVGAYTTIKRNYACRMCHPVLDSFNFCFRFFFFSGRSSLYLLRYGHKTTRTSPTGERDLFTSTRFQVSEKKKKILYMIGSRRIVVYRNRICDTLVNDVNSELGKILNFFYFSIFSSDFGYIHKM